MVPGSMADRRKTPERERTDSSLRAKRMKADRALADHQWTTENEADQVVRLAREHADAVLVDARAEADGQLGREDSGATQVVAAERAVHDDTLRSERHAADELLQQQRVETAAALKRLLPLEREATDRYLLSERGRSDTALSNRDDFLGMVSHDLRDLIGAIVVTAGLIAKRAIAEEEGGQQAVALTERIQRYAARMNRLIGDLVDVTSIDAGKLAVSAAPGYAGGLISDVVETFHGPASARRMAIEAEVVDGPLLAVFDHDRLLQVLANLVSNAIKFTPEGGQVVVRGERVDAGIRFCVSDSGPGIPGEMLDAIFERFRQVTASDRRGLGLGLYISKCIVEAHGGTIWAESERGEGARICFVVPEGAERRR